MHDCVFCALLAGTLPVSRVYKDEYCTAFMDIQPVNPGHVLVVPNRHAAYLGDLDDATAAHMFQLGRRIGASLRHSGVRCEGVDFFLADGEAAGQEIFHTHLHVFPRFEGDGFGFVYGPEYQNRPEREELDETAARIRASL